MSFSLSSPKTITTKAFSSFLRAHFHHIIAVALIGAWCAPYITTGTKVEWGDFGLFTQGYEAIRITVLQYHQFPWFDPWIAGGVPLYANPQIGVFSVQTILVLIFGAPVGLKLAVIVYTFGGYVSTYVLARYIKIKPLIASLIALLWLFSSFFVSHIPAHYTFVWFMLAPLFVYLTLRARDFKSGIWLGLAFAIMGLSEIHYSFFQIGLVCAAIAVIRVISNKERRGQLVKAYLGASVVFIVLTGHRLLLTVENAKDFPRAAAVLFDPSVGFAKSLLSVTLPYSEAHSSISSLLHYPSTHYGWGEQTMTVGIFASFALFLGTLYYLYSWRNKRLMTRANRDLGALLLLLILLFFIMGIGAFSPLSPYALLRHLPIFSDTRVAPRWFLWAGLSALLFIGWLLSIAPKKSFFKFAGLICLGLGVIELFVLNFGYQSRVLSHPVTIAPLKASTYTFEQEGVFGSTLKLPDGKGTIPNDGTLPHFYREYEATTFNLGTLQANDAFVDLNTKPTPRCSWVSGCGFVMSHNARVTYWSPNKVILQRTGNGPIELDENNSNYFLINGVRDNSIRVSEPYKPFIINLPDSVHTINITTSPILSAQRLKHAL